MKPTRKRPSRQIGEFFQPSKHARPTPKPRVLSTFINTISLMLLVIFSTTITTAQTAAVIPEGWVVLPVDEYRALRRAAFHLDVDPLPLPV